MRKPTWQEREAHWGLRPMGRWSAASFAVAEATVAMRRAAIEGTRRRRLQRLAGAAAPQVSLGSGAGTPAGWIGLDLERRGTRVYPWDLRRGLPFADGTVRAFLLEHSLEHLYLDDARRLIVESFRALRPGGAIRIVSPDVRFLVSVATGARTREVVEQIDCDQEIHRWRHNDELDLFITNRLSHQWGAHLSLLSGPWVQRMLRKAGFDNVLSVTPDTSACFDPVPSTHRERFPGPDHEAFAVEGRRPLRGET